MTAIIDMQIAVGIPDPGVGDRHDAFGYLLVHTTLFTWNIGAYGLAQG